MNALDLKNYISDKDLVPDILESLGCHSIKSYPKEYRAGLPDKRNPTAISIKKGYLKTRVYGDIDSYSGDIFTLAMNIKNFNFVQSIKHIHKILGLKYEVFSPIKDDKPDILAVFKKVAGGGSRKTEELKVYDDNVLNSFINIPNIWWVREGIPPDIQERFKLGYCPYSNRITIPQRYWCGGENSFIGCKGRTVLEDYELLGVPKYMALIPFPKTLNVYGLQENYKEIQEAGEVIVFEAEKSVLKMSTWKYNNAVAILGHELSQEQINILIGLDVDICIAFDKDIPESFIKKTCDKFKITRNVTYIYDQDDLLEPKMSPVDKKKSTFDYLYKHRIKV